MANEFESPDHGRREQIAHFRRRWRALFETELPPARM